MKDNGVNDSPDGAKKRAPSPWDTRKNIADLHGLEVARKYDEYLKEHARRLKGLSRVASGEMAPSGDWYMEKKR